MSLPPPPPPRALHLPGIPDTCALRIVPATFVSGRCSFGERPATVLRASGEKAAPSQEFSPSKCSVYKCSCKAQRHTLGTFVLLETGRGLSPGNLHFEMEFFKAPKPAVRGGGGGMGGAENETLMKSFQTQRQTVRIVLRPTPSPGQVSPRECFELIFR